MGNGIAQVFALHGYQVSLYDLHAEALPNALQTIEKNLNRMVAKGKIDVADVERTMGAIRTYSSLKAAVETADLVVEAATEDEALKQDLFQQLDRFTPTHSILASNTSSIAISRLEETTSRMGQVIGMHFFNPVPMMQLVEVIRTPMTQASVFDAVFNLAKKLQKVPVEVNDAPGFVANRVLMPMINEAANALDEGVADIAAIDTVMQLGMAHPMGPLRLADFIGLDVCVAILEVLQSGLENDHYTPAPILKKLVAQKALGQKSGKGFYDYTVDPKKPIPRMLK